MDPNIDPFDGHIPARDEDEAATDLARELVAETRRFAKAELELAKIEIGRLAEEARERLRLDVEVARREVVVEAKRAGRAGAITGAGALVLHAALYLFLFMLVFALAKAMPL